jgi:hypothetical protein
MGGEADGGSIRKRCKRKISDVVFATEELNVNMARQNSKESERHNLVSLYVYL